MQERKIIRLKNYDYTTPNLYFITICTMGMEPYFGRVLNKKMVYSAIGEKAIQNWLKIPGLFNKIKLYDFIVMPNHVHGILEIRRSPYSNQNSKSASNKFGAQPKGSLPVIIGQYKSSITRWCNRNRFSYFAWQPRFYDRIIRNRHEFYRIRQYILKNPAKWTEDEYYTNK
ncbi:MAG: hypothetical protein PVF73_04880 [Bacteroidales bacterium]|jgi:REP element-mobilizing transposase RayT